MGTLPFMMLYVFMVVMAITVFGVGILVVTLLEQCLQQDPGAERIRKTHQNAVKQINEVVDYYAGLQQYIADRLAGLRK